MMVDAEEQRNHYFDLLKYLLFILVVLIHNPLPGNIGGALTAIARSAVPAYIAISGYFSKRVGKKYLKKGLNFLRIFFLMNLIWFVIYTLISYSPYRELAMWAKLAVNPKNVLECLLFGSAFGNEYLWYLHAIGMIYITVYFVDKFQLNKVIYWCFPFLILLNWIMSEGTLLILGKNVQPFLYRNWMIEGIGFYYMGKWMIGQECNRRFSYVMLVVGSVMTIVEYSICGRAEFYFGNLLMVYGMLALGKSIYLKDNILSMIGSKHSLHLYLYSPFIACVFSLIQMILFQTTRHQEIITVLVIFGTTWLVMQGWFIKAIEKLKIA
jgi:fucose 4-O-acetylase-like acetyltransferase